MLSIVIPEKFKWYFNFSLLGEGVQFHSSHVVYIPLKKNTMAVVGLPDNATTFIRNLLCNFALLSNVSGLTLTYTPDQVGKSYTFQVKATQVMRFAHLVNATHTVNADRWISATIRGMMTSRASVNGSKLYKNYENVEVSPYAAISQENRKLLVGSYIGKMVLAFFVVIFTSGTVLVYIVVCIFLRSPAGGAWELLQAHKRECGD